MCNIVYLFPLLPIINFILAVSRNCVNKRNKIQYDPLIFFKTKTVILKYHLTKHQSSFMRQLLIILAFLPVMAARAQSGRQPMSVTDMLKIKTVNNVTLTDDGTMAAFVVTAIEPEADSAKWDYKYINQLWVVSTEPGAVPRQLTFTGMESGWETAGICKNSRW